MVWWPVREAVLWCGEDARRSSLAHPHLWPSRSAPPSLPATSAVATLWAWQGLVLRAAWLWQDLSGM